MGFFIWLGFYLQSAGDILFLFLCPFLGIMVFRHILFLVFYSVHYRSNIVLFAELYETSNTERSLISLVY